MVSCSLAAASNRELTDRSDVPIIEYCTHYSSSPASGQKVLKGFLDLNLPPYGGFYVL